MKKYLGEKIVDILTPDFTTSTYDSKIAGKISIMGSFKKYFDYKMKLCGCGLPYIILEGSAEDYRKIITKAKELSKYQFDWYINRIIPHVEKMAEEKEGKIDIEYFKNMIQKDSVTQTRKGASGRKSYEVQVDYICGWFLNFFAYYKFFNKIQPFTEDKILVEQINNLANQMLIVPFTMEDINHKTTYLMKFKVGFAGCEQNDKKEVIPVQGWFVSPCTEEE